MGCEVDAPQIVVGAVKAVAQLRNTHHHSTQVVRVADKGRRTWGGMGRCSGLEEQQPDASHSTPFVLRVR